MNLRMINNLANQLKCMTNQIMLPQVFYHTNHIANTREQILLVANDICDDSPWLSSKLTELKDRLFPVYPTGRVTVNPVILGEIIFALDILANSNQDRSIADEWSYIHPRIAEVSKKLYLDGHYKNASEDAFIELNDRVKRIYLKAKPDANPVPDGTALMNKVFNASSPICELQDVGTESGYNIQLGIQHMCAGSMSAFRNPKAHSNNEELTAEEAMRRLMFVSSLMYAIDDARRINDRSNDKEG